MLTLSTRIFLQLQCLLFFLVMLSIIFCRTTDTNDIFIRLFVELKCIFTVIYPIQIVPQ